jgi:hypothetical protein
MTLWLIRAGSRGEHEQKFLDEGKIYLTWGGLMQAANQQRGLRPRRAAVSMQVSCS